MNKIMEVAKAEWLNLSRNLKVWNIKRKLRKLENLYNSYGPEDYDCGADLFTYINPEVGLANERFMQLNLRLRHEFGEDYYKGKWVQP